MISSNYGKDVDLDYLNSSNKQKIISKIKNKKYKELFNIPAKKTIFDNNFDGNQHFFFDNSKSVEKFQSSKNFSITNFSNFPSFNQFISK